MKIDDRIVNQLNTLKTKDIIELISIIGESLKQRRDQFEGKITIGCLLVNLAVSTFESIECDINVSITKPEWQDTIEYSTGVTI